MDDKNKPPVDIDDIKEKQKKLRISVMKKILRDVKPKTV